MPPPGRHPEENPCVKRPVNNLLLILVLLLSAACTSMRGTDVGLGEYWVKPARPLSRSESLLLYVNFVRGLPTAELAREHERLQQAFAADPSDFTRLRYALLLTVPGSAARDQARAVQLLDPVTRDGEGRDPALRAMASLLAADLAERRRLEDSLQSAAQRQKEELSERRRLEGSLQAATQQYKDEQLRSAELEHKLEALKSIEKTISQRDRKAAIPAPEPAKQ